VGEVPWGYSIRPPLPPVVEPPGRFHPRPPHRRILSLAGRARRRLYALGLVVGLPAGLAMLALELGARGGIKVGSESIPSWTILEVVSALAAIGLIAAGAYQGAQRRADGWRDFAGPSPFLLMAAQQATVAAIGIPISLVLSNLKVDMDSAYALLAVVPLYLVVYFGLVHFLVVRPGAMTWRDILRPARLAPEPGDWSAESLAERLGWRRPATRLRAWLRGSLGDFLLAASVVIPVLIATGLTNVVLIAALGLNGNEVQSDVPMHPTTVEKLLTIVMIAILIPIGEEVFFRGYATNAWGRSLSRSSALLRAGLFFAFVHVINTQNTDAWTSLRAATFNFGARIPVALALCWLYMRRRSLVASVSLHGLYNGLIVVISFLVTSA
jgi:membrane protease YdiL (CAAX protease family)